MPARKDVARVVLYAESRPLKVVNQTRHAFLSSTRFHLAREIALSSLKTIAFHFSRFLPPPLPPISSRLRRPRPVTWHLPPALLPTTLHHNYIELRSICWFPRHAVDSVSGSVSLPCSDPTSRTNQHVLAQAIHLGRLRTRCLGTCCQDLQHSTWAGLWPGVRSCG